MLMNEIDKPAQDNSKRILLLLGMLWLILGAAILYAQLSGPAEIEIAWVTETEFETAGFNIFRSDDPDGEYSQINDQLVPSQGDPASGFSYTYMDSGVEPGRTYYYRLQEVEFDNSRQFYDVGSGVDPVIEPWAIILAAVSLVVGLFLLAIGLRPEKDVWMQSRPQDLTQMSSGEY